MYKGYKGERGGLGSKKDFCQTGILRLFVPFAPSYQSTVYKTASIRIIVKAAILNVGPVLKRPFVS